MPMALLRAIAITFSAAASICGLAAAPATSAPPACWQPQDERENQFRESGSVPHLPEALRQEKVTRTVIAFKLCIDQAGGVTRVATRTSSGNKKIDRFFRDAVSTWKYRPRRVGSEDRPSVAFVTVTLAVLPDEP